MKLFKKPFFLFWVKAGIAGLAVLCLIALLQPPLRLKYGPPIQLTEIKEIEHIDVAFAGGSHAAAGFNPAVLQEEAGLSSFNFATGGQPIYLTYYYLKEVLKHYEFDLLVLDLYYLGLDADYFQHESYIRRVIDNLPLSLNKIDMIEHCVSEDKLSYFVPLLQYHTRWEELEANDLDYDHWSAPTANRGWAAGSETVGVELSEEDRTDELLPIPTRSEEYLLKILDLMESRNIRVVFTSLPHQYNQLRPDNNWVENEYALFNSVRAFSAEREIPFLEFNELLEEMDFDFPQDMHNATHMNILGAEKVSRYLAEYLSPLLSD